MLVLYVYAAFGLVISVPLMLLLGPAAGATNGTSVRLFGAALFALAVGAVAVGRDPARNKVVLVMETVFTALASLALTSKVLIHHSHPGFDERDYLFLAFTLVCLILLLSTFPYGEERDDRKETHDAGNDSRF